MYQAVEIPTLIYGAETWTLYKRHAICALTRAIPSTLSVFGDTLSAGVESISHLFASLTRERYFQHLKIKFVSPRSHVTSSIYVIFSCSLITCVVFVINITSLFSFNNVIFKMAIQGSLRPKGNRVMGSWYDI